MNKINIKTKNILLGTVISVIIIAVLYFLASSDYFAAKFGSNAIVITNCSSIEPSAITAKESDVINFINKDNVDHKIFLGGIILTINPGRSEKLQAKFPLGDGSYGYSCDNVNLAGQIQIHGAAATSVVVKNTLKDAYDYMPEGEQACFKKILGKDFDKALKEPTFRSADSEILEKINACFAENAKQTTLEKGE